MNPFIRKTAYTGPVLSVVLDWAGTAVDHGCKGPAAVFVNVFAQMNVAVSTADARRFMGLAKKDHIRKMCNLPEVSAAWARQHGRLPDETDVDDLYRRTAAMMKETLSRHSDPIEGVIDTVERLRSMGIRIGSCTGYVREMMDVLVPAARRRGYEPDAVVCSSDVPAGRPFPWMCYINAIQLGTYPMEAMVKIGDTIADIEEGLNAGMWTVGITRTGNELGLTSPEVNALDPEDLNARLNRIDEQFKQAGAHYTLETLADILPVVNDINQKLKAGKNPL
jgi:phosphonoacetaldehyde hydrolase